MSDDNKMTHFELVGLLKKLQVQVNAQEQKQIILESENQQYKDALKALGKETAFDRIKKQKAYKAPVRELSVLVKEPMLNQRGDNYYPTADKSCPFCNHKQQDNFLDQMDSGRWACRQCGKMWFTAQLNQPYTTELEKQSGSLNGVYSDVGSREA